MIDQHWLHHTVEEPLRIWTCFSEEEGWEPSERVWTTEGYEGLPPSEGGGRVQAQDSIYLSHGTVSGNSKSIIDWSLAAGGVP